MKQYLILFLTILIQLSAKCQNKKEFGQIAFEFYSDSILSKVSTDKRFISPKLVDDVRFWNIACLKEFNIRIDDTVALYIQKPKNKKIKKFKDRGFECTKLTDNRNPIIFITTTLSKKENDNFITAVVEKYSDKYISYIFEIDENKKIIKWCKGEVILY